MLSKSTFKRMVQEVSVPILINVTLDAVSKLDEKKEPGDEFQDQLNFVEMCVTELRNRAPQPERKQRKKEE